MKDTSVWLLYFTRTGDKLYFVEKVKNRVSPSPGDVLSKGQVERLIDNGAQVFIKERRPCHDPR